MTASGNLLDIRASPKKKGGKRYNKHLIIIRLSLTCLYFYFLNGVWFVFTSTCVVWASYFIYAICI